MKTLLMAVALAAAFTVLPPLAFGGEFSEHSASVGHSAEAPERADDPNMLSETDIDEEGNDFGPIFADGGCDADCKAIEDSRTIDLDGDGTMDATPGDMEE